MPTKQRKYTIFWHQSDKKISDEIESLKKQLNTINGQLRKQSVDTTELYQSTKKQNNVAAFSCCGKIT